MDHKKHALKNVRIGIITVSDTRNVGNDESGRWIGKSSADQGHEVVVYRIIPDEKSIIAETVLESIQNSNIHALVLTGGTGIAIRDVTIEAVKPMFEKEMTGFGELFAYLSFQEIGSAAILSRAFAGIIKKTSVFCIPGSLKACHLACKSLIFPELGHIAIHLRDG